MPRHALAPLNPQDAFRRNALVILLGTSGVAAAVSLIVTPLIGLSGLDRLGPVLIAVKAVIFLLWLWVRPQAFRVVGTIELTVEAATGVLKLASILLVDQLSAGLGGYVMWLPQTYILAALVLPGRWSLLVSLGVYALLLVPGVMFWSSEAIPPAVKASFGNTIVQMYLLHAALIAFFALLGRAMEAYATAERQLEHNARLAHSDALTGLANRRQLMDWLERATQDSTRTGEAFSVLLFDLDHFKGVNDTFGHDTGDDVLRFTAQVARTVMRDQDRLGRWGGEEFMVILPDCDERGAERIAVRLQWAMGARPHPRAGAITVSCGVAARRPGEDASDVLRHADEALYAAKREGRNAVRTRSRGPMTVPQP